MNTEAGAGWLFDLDPVWFRFGPAEVRYYSVCFFLVFVVGYAFWQRQMLRGEHAVEPTSRFVLWGAAGVVLGGRLAHCLFYEPDHYLAHPLQILDLRRGGLASHGSATGLFVALLLYARRFEYSLLEVMDRFALSGMIAGSFVRLGNFANSEIVGREWSGPLAVRFARYAESSQRIFEREHGALGWEVQPLPRHPVQLYEWAGMLAIFGVLFAVDRHYGERRPRGLMVGLLFVLYFSFRWLLEGVKEFQRFGNLVPDAAARVIRVEPTTSFTMGQWLSVPFVMLGAGLVIYALRTRLPASASSRFDVE